MNLRKIIILLITLSVLLTAAVCVHTVGAESDIKEAAESTAVFSAEKVSSFRASSRTVSTIRFKWDKKQSASGYQLQMKKNGAYESVGKTTKNAITLSNLKSGKIYYLRLRAYSKNGGKTAYTKWAYLHATTSPDDVTVKKSTSDNRKVTLTWKKQSCTGYHIQYSKRSDFSSRSSKVIGDSTVTAYTTKTLKASTKYYFRIRAYHTCDGKKYYSKWTAFTVTTDKGCKTTPKGYKIETVNGVTYVDGVLIANKTYSIPRSYAPGGLTSECNSAFSRMRSAAAKDGVNLYIVSGYRSYDTQKRIYNNYVAKDGKALADTYSARPGTSEHQTGLAMDLNSLSSSFGNTREGKWLEKNCHKYGFIIRYPKGKQNVTGYVYEPWHVRYIGVEKATKIYKSGLCLEEYYGITSRYN